MKRRTRWVLGLAVLGAAVALAFVLWPGDRDRLQGVWVADGTRLTVSGDTAVLDGPAYREPHQSYFRLEPRASPKRIIIWSADAPTGPPRRVLGVAFGIPGAAQPDSEMHGLYEMTGDRLRLCLPLPGQDFPTAFDPSQGMIMELRRE
jgi:uncharacterized protein (TIGR03067 family)